MKIIKVNKAHILNEDVLSVGYSGQGYNTSGFSYSIMPLLFNLNQKGNDAEPSIKNKAFKFLVGDMVKGFCPYDNKKHEGIIKYMYYTVENNESPKLVYILDLSNNIMVPLTPDTLVKIVEPHPTSNVGTNYLGSGSSHVGYDLDQYSPVKESIDFNKLILWNDNISFNKSDNNLKNASKKSINNIFYDFLNCKFGDKIYYDKTLGYNLLEGDYIGFCCIEAGQLDNKPRFAYKENLIGEYTWRSAIEYLKTIKNCNCYLPSLDELNLAFTNCKFTNSYWWTYWSSTEDANNERAFSIRPENMHIFPYDKTLENHVRPFIHISQLENKLYESFDFNKALLSLDDNEIEFSKTLNTLDKSNKKAIDNTLYDFLNCKFGDKIYYDETLGYNLLKGEYIGICCIEAGLLDDKPKFVYIRTIYKTNWNDAKKKCKKILNGYLPDKKELKIAYDNGIKLIDHEAGLSTRGFSSTAYWTSTSCDFNNAYCLGVGDIRGIYATPKQFDNYIQPFIHIDCLKNKLHESFDFNKALLSLDDNEIEFSKSDNSLNIANKRSLDFYNFKKLNIGDSIFKDDELGWNTKYGELVGYYLYSAKKYMYFIYKEKLRQYVSGITAKKVITKFGKEKYNTNNFFLPELGVLVTAKNNNLLPLSEDDRKTPLTYWTDTFWHVRGDLHRLAYNTEKGSIDDFPLAASACIIPCFKLPIENNVIKESFDFNKELLKLDNLDNIEFDKTKISNDKIGNISTSFLIENMLSDYLDKSSYLTNMKILKINDTESCILPNNSNDPIYSPFTIRIKNKKLDIICKNNWGFNMNPSEETYNLPEAINLILRCGITFNSLTLRDVDMTLRNSHRFFLYYGELLKYDLLPKKIIIEDTALRHKHDVSHYSFSILPYNDPDGNFNKGKYFDIDKCIYLKNWLESCDIKMIVFHPDMITKDMYGLLYCKVDGEKNINFDILNITLKFYNSIFNISTYRLNDDTKEKPTIKYEYLSYRIKNYMNDNGETEDIKFAFGYATAIAYFIYNTKMPFYIRSLESYSMYRSFTLEFYWGYPDVLISDMQTYVENSYFISNKKELDEKILELVNDAIAELYKIDHM